MSLTCTRLACIAGGTSPRHFPASSSPPTQVVVVNTCVGKLVQMPLMSFGTLCSSVGGIRIHIICAFLLKRLLGSLGWFRVLAVLFAIMQGSSGGTDYDS